MLAKMTGTKYGMVPLKKRFARPPLSMCILGSLSLFFMILFSLFLPELTALFSMMSAYTSTSFHRYRTLLLTRKGK